MPVNVQSHPRKATKIPCRPTQPPPPPPLKPASITEVCLMDSITAMEDVSHSVLSKSLVAENSRKIANQNVEKNCQLSQKASDDLKTSSVHLAPRKLAPPVPTKPAHLQRKSLTPPPNPGSLSSELGLSSHSLPDYELSDLEHPQLSSTLKPLFLRPLSAQQSTTDEEDMQVSKPPKAPVRRESMRQSHEVVLKEVTSFPRKQVSIITSLEESFCTRFKPTSTFPAPDLFTNCEKTYPSKEKGSFARIENYDEIEIKPLATNIAGDEVCGNPKHQTTRKPTNDPPPPPLPKTAPPSRNGSSINFYNPTPPIPNTQVTMIIPPPPPLPVEKVKMLEEKPVGSIIPPPLPLPSTVPCPTCLPQNNKLDSCKKSSVKVQLGSPTNQSMEIVNIEDSPFSVKKIARSGFAENLAKIYSSNRLSESIDPNASLSQNTKPSPNPIMVSKKPALLICSGMKVGPTPRLQSLKIKSPKQGVPGLGSITESPLKVLPRSVSSVSLTLAASSPLSASKAKSSSVTKLSNIARSAPPPPPPFRTSSMATIPQYSCPPAVQSESSVCNTDLPPPQLLNRSQSFRAAPPPPVSVHGSTLSLDRSQTLIHPVLKMPESPARTDTPPPEAISRRYSFRVAPPPPPKHKPSEPHLVETSASKSTNRLRGSSGVAAQSPSLLIC